jgi:hypothetical protein
MAPLKTDYILFITTISSATELVCPSLPSISVKFVVYLVCTKLLSELLVGNRTEQHETGQNECIEGVSE